MSTGLEFEDVMTDVASHADGKLLAGRIDHVGVLLFNQPEKRNAVNLEMWDGVCETLDRFAGDPAIRVVVYAGAGGKAFSAGNDISQFAARRDSADANTEFSRLTGRGRNKLIGLPKPSIACIRGFCLGGGLVTALLADLRVAAPNAVLGLPAARLGIAFGADPMERLIALVGPARARLMLYTARTFNAQEAFDLGLVEVMAEADGVAETLDLASSIAANAPLSVMAAKFTVDEVGKPPQDRDVAALAEHTRRCMDSADYREGRAAFTAKRKPTFVGA